MKKSVRYLGLAALAVVAASPALAAPPDVSSTVSEIKEYIQPVIDIGLAAFSVIIAAACIKYLRRAA